VWLGIANIILHRNTERLTNSFLSTVAFAGVSSRMRPASAETLQSVFPASEVASYFV